MLARRVPPCRAFAACLAIFILASCGRSDGHKSSKENSSVRSEDSIAAVEPTDPIVQKIEADITSPILFAIMYGSNGGNGIPTSVLDNNMNLNANGAALVSGADNTVRNDRSWCRPPSFAFHFSSGGQWMAARVLQRLEGSALLRDDGTYIPSPQLLAQSTFWFQRDGWCARWYFFDLGHFRTISVEQINEFDGPDKQTGASTKIRSYKVTAEFVPSATLTALAPTADFGKFDWTVAVERNPMTLDWDIYNAGTTNWNP